MIRTCAPNNFLLLLALCTAAIGCEPGAAKRGTAPAPTMDTAPPSRTSADDAQPQYDTASLMRERAAKDAALQQPDSPIPDEARANFKGLHYYKPDAAFAIPVKLERLAPPVQVQIAATKGDVRQMWHLGRFTFMVAGTKCRLSVYALADQPKLLFVPFRDQTNGTDTYEVGRYIDLEIRGDDMYVLDFNRAYNPYCAYSPRFTCPIVPRENILSVPITAGEKLPGFAH